MSAVTMKRCTGCRRRLPATTEYFHRHAPAIDGLKPRCKSCRCENAKADYRALSDEERQAYIAAVQQRDERTPAEAGRRVQRWKTRNRARWLKIKAASHRRLSQRASYRLNRTIRREIGRSLNGGKAGRRSLSDLQAHLERLFALGMTWENYGDWHVDHRRPLASFQFATSKDPEFREAWALTNLQPLWAVDNLRKGARWTS